MASGISRVAAIISLAGGLGHPAIGCSGSPAAPAPTQVSVSFNGTINPLGSSFNTFTVNYAGGTSDASVGVSKPDHGRDRSARVNYHRPREYGIVSLGVCNLSILNHDGATQHRLADERRTVSAGTWPVEIFGQHRRAKTKPPRQLRPHGYALLTSPLPRPPKAQSICI